MIHGIISFSIKNKLVIGLFTVVLVVAGIWSLTKIPLDAVPDITNNQVQVITQAPNLSTEDVEQFVTYPVELAMANLPGVVEIRSISRFGLSAVTIVFEDDMGNYLPRQLVAEKLEQVRDEVPPNFGSPFMGPITTGLGEIYQYTLEVDPAFKDTYSLYDLRSMQDWIIRRQMAMVPGVIEVNAFGGAVKQYEVAVDPARLDAFNLTMDDVFTVLEANNENTGGSYIEYDYRANFIRAEGLVTNLDDIRSMVVKQVDGFSITIDDIATVGFGNGVRYGAFTSNGNGEGVGGIILMLKGENSNEVIKRVKKRMAEIQKSLPEGVTISPFLDRSELISNTTSTVINNLTEGALIVIFVLVFLLGNWRGGLIVASTIPLSLLFAFILMNVFDVWANLMSLGAIDFGIIVDGAVIIVEGTVFLMHRNVLNGVPITPKERDETALTASKKMMNSAFFGQLIILVVFLPILALEGIEGKMFRPMALTFMFAMIGVMILCLTYVPMMSSFFLRASKPTVLSIGDRWVHWLEKHYERGLEWALKRGYWIGGIALSLFVGAVLTFNQLGGEFIPRLDEGDIAFHDLLKPGSSLEEAVRVTTLVEQTLLDEFPEVERVLSRIGVSDVPIDLMPMDAADCFIKLKPKEEWETAETKEELIDKIKDRLLQIPGVNYEFTQPIEMRFNELMTGIRQDVAIKIYGEDLTVLAAKADEVASLIGNVEGVSDLRVEATEGQPQITISYDREQMAVYGVHVQELNTFIKTAFAGRKAGVVFEGERRFDLVLRVDEESRSGLEDVQNLFIRLPSGNQVPIKEVATIDYRPGPMQISRDNTNRRTYVGINVRGRDVQSTIEEIEAILEENLRLPEGYYIRFGGAFENLERATKRLQIVVPLTLGLIFVFIFIALRSLSQTLIIYISIPMAAIGGVFSLWLRDMPFSISAGIGFIVLFGIAVLNGLVLMSGWNELKSSSELSLVERTLSGAKRRVRPILLTASTDILGFLPMALSATAGAEVQRPLATVVIGGMISSTLLTLFLLPVLYRALEKRKQMGLSASSMKPALTGFVLLFVCSAQGVAQQETQEIPIGIEEAVQRATAHYPGIKAAAFSVDKQQKLKKTAWDLGQTTLFTSGDEVDNRNEGVRTVFGLQQQNIDLFGVPAKSKLQHLSVSLAESGQALTILEVQYQVKMAYAGAFAAKEHMKLMQKQDSVFREFERAAGIRYNVEDGSKLEYLAAANESRRATLALQEAEYDYAIAVQLLNKWLGNSDSLFVVSDELNWLQEPEKEPGVQTEHPILKRALGNLEVSRQRVQVVRSQALPKVNVLYGIQRVNGLGGFHQYQAGISIPLLFNSQAGQVQAAKLDENISEQELEQTKLEYERALETARVNYEKWKETWVYYQQEAIPLALEQLSGSQLAFEQGAIDYLEFLNNARAALQVQQSAVEAMKAYAEAKCYLEYYVNT
ncbi:MAG: CusA/CzcA family heavy metal efflux RND transporter [Bacteroidota bacterium]